MATAEKINNQLAELKGSGFEIVDGQPDITGWNIKARSGKKIGEVHDLLFEPETRKVRYLVADLDDNELHLEDDRKVLIPIGIAELYVKGDKHERHQDPAYSAYDPADDGNVVYLHDVSAAQLDDLPLYEKNHLSRSVEISIRKIFEVQGNPDNDDFYRHEHFNDDRFYQRKRK
jgi:hypothetical protein